MAVWLDLATASLFFVFYSLQWIFFSTFSAALYSLRLVAWPFGVLLHALLFVFAPVIYTVRFLLSPIFVITRNFPRLEPLYIYFGSAAFIGIAVGVFFRLTTYSTFTLLGLDNDDETSRKSRSRFYSAGPSAQSTQLSLSEKSHNSQPVTPVSERKDFDALLAGISSEPESDQLIAALQSAGGGGGWRDSPNTKRKRRSASGLGGGGSGLARFSTILEEEDDSL
ncbi:hypothetical protein M406DRAFT_334883 [Cryphonectria parasitica EP155]|uniref:Uncharacterized protein n=1 Tax=Cryphonectria parasitica (strain ATCC 38755 / EP155) TaxID=660469 RepID=A0A9P4XRT5_CRYP1|nr:uncharacterized protein M406DRAFT_334883 [Cryphonectria parasitica EP155]KAF3760207.1 hypothetical protein M406DRAFT_334883 [Cryphonectria parasitica EP155]